MLRSEQQWCPNRKRTGKVEERPADSDSSGSSSKRQKGEAKGSAGKHKAARASPDENDAPADSNRPAPKGGLCEQMA